MKVLIYQVVFAAAWIAGTWIVVLRERKAHRRAAERADHSGGLDGLVARVMRGHGEK